jgi:hypothetical protein
MIHARWTLFEPAALRYALVAAGSTAALAIVAASSRRAPRHETNALPAHVPVESRTSLLTAP